MQNVLAVGGEPLEITFHQSNGITLIKGLNLDVTSKSSNGAGKSTIIEGILIALYGRTLRREGGKPLSVEAVLHDENDNLTGRVELEYDDTKIVRTFNPNKVAYWVGGVQASTNASATQVKKDLQDHVNVNFETMCSILLFGQHNQFSFLEAGEADKREVVENLMNLKEYNLYEERARELKRETKKKVETLVFAHRKTEEHFASQRAMLDSHKRDALAYRSRIDVEIEDMKTQLLDMVDVETLKKQWEKYEADFARQSELQSKENHLSQRVAELSHQIYEIGLAKERELARRDPLIETINGFDKKLITLEHKKRALYEDVAKLGREAEKFANLRVTLAAEQFQKTQQTREDARLKDAEDRLSDTRRRGQEIREQIELVSKKEVTAGVVCPTCYGRIDPANAKGYIEHLNVELNRLRQEYATVNAEVEAERKRVDEAVQSVMAEWQAKISEANQAEFEARKEAEELRANIDEEFNKRVEKIEEERTAKKLELDNFEKEVNAEFISKCNPLSSEKSKCQEELKAVKGQMLAMRLVKPAVAIEDVGALAAKREQLVNDIEKKTKELDVNPYTNIIESLQKSVDELSAKDDEEKLEINNTESMIPYYDFWVDAMGKEGIKSFIIDGIVPTLNEQIEYWMQLIYQGTISVSFDKYLNVTIKNNASRKGLKRYGQGSGGERRRIDIAIMLAFRQIMKMSTGKDPNVVFFDEVAENIDEEGLVWLYDVLRDLAKTTRVFVITHNPGLLSLLEGGDVITIVKKNGASTLLA
jgi:DNA repair exonuclease SbcCD ATPase subunit